MAAGTLSRLIADDREPTAEERESLAGFPGWGATPELFDPKSSKYRGEREYLSTVWSDTEWAQARRTILNAHYTHPEYVAAMWDTMHGLGVPESARVLEPGCGKGNFIAAAPEGTRMEGVELDATSARIAGLLNPGATIHNESFADFFLTHDGFDGAIGNVPFSQETLHDPAYNEARLSLHGHFLAKSLRMTKPGGVVTLMSSRWLLDGKSDAARRELAKYGELIGAVRQPAGAHQAEAGTDAIVDVLIFRRHLDDAEPTQHQDWMGTITLETGDGDGVQYNEYFAERPDQVIGDLETRIGRFGPELTVQHPDASDPAVMGAQLRGRLERIVAEAKSAGLTWQAQDSVVAYRPAARVVQRIEDVVGRVFIADDGTIMKNMPDSAHPMSGVNKYRKEIASLVGLRDAAVKLLEHEARTTEDTNELAEDRVELNRLYDAYVEAYGPINRADFTTRMVDGEETIRRNIPKAVAILKDDPHFPTVLALEHFDDETQTATKADVFDKRVVHARSEVTSCKTPGDAIAVALDRAGYLDEALVSTLLDVPLADVEAELGDLAFRDPENGDRLVPAREYLSGDVRKRLHEIEALIEDRPDLERNAAALREVVPADLTAEEIDVKLGVNWVPDRYYKEWLASLLGKEVREFERLNGEIDFTLRGSIGSYEEMRWGATGDRESVSALVLVKKVMNNKPLRMTYKPDKDGPTLLDIAGTEAMQQKAEDLRENFQDWLWRDGERSATLLEEYNSKFNGIVLRNYDDYQLSLPGLTATFTPRPHQVAAVARMINEPAVGLFHEVGAGKTAATVMGVMELKRLGQCNKPAIVVPNHMLEQFSREAAALYPRARILAIGSDDVAKKGSKDGRAMFVARAKTGDWDMVIITHNAFQRVGLGEAKVKFAEERLRELRERFDAYRNSPIKTGSAKRMEQALLREEEKIKKMLDMNQDEGIDFESTGIDYLAVDEAHLYKNLMVDTKIPDLQKTRQSQRAFDLEMKLWYFREMLGQSRVVTLATGTPLPNQLSEMYVMQRYLRPDLLKAAGVYELDDWAIQFTDQEVSVEQKVEGGYQMKSRTKRFRNMPELLRLWHTPGDIKLSKDLNLPLPALAENSEGKRAPENVAVPATAAQTKLMADLIERGERVRAGAVAPEEDNLLKITNDGRHAALDTRLLGMEGPDEYEDSKVSIAAEKIAVIYHANKDRTYLAPDGTDHPTPGALQLVFSDLGVPREGRWNMYDGLRDALIEKGVPADLVRFMGDAKTDTEKAQLFSQCRSGQVAVLIGSTERMGVGTNVQARCVALHHLDAPWRPSDVTQREGRILRQGNQNGEVQIFRYATEGSFDAFMWSLLARKEAFIQAVLSGSIHVREIEEHSETSLSFAEMQAIASGDMRLLQKANLENDVKKLENRRRAFMRGQTSTESRRRALEQQADIAERDVEQLVELQKSVVPTEGDNFRGHFSGMETTERANLGNALVTYIHEVKDGLQRSLSLRNEDYPMPIHRLIGVGGVDFRMEVKWNRDSPSDPLWVFRPRGTYDSRLEFQSKQSALLSAKPSEVAQRFERRVSRIGQEIQERREFAEAKRVEVEQLRDLENREFPSQAEFDTKKQELHDLVVQLEAEAREAKSDYLSQINAFLSNGTEMHSPELVAAYRAGVLEREIEAARQGLITPDVPLEHDGRTLSERLQEAVERHLAAKPAMDQPAAEREADYAGVGRVIDAARRMLREDPYRQSPTPPPAPRY